jgi:thiol-disulfide isomerase/thioredoxin
VTVACSSPSPYAEADRIELAQCLSEQGYIKYGTEWCPHCRTQRELFGDDVFRAHVNYVDCDDQAEVCAIAGVE